MVHKQDQFCMIIPKRFYRMLPPPLKKKKVEEPVDDIPEVLQGEIARLDQRFKVSFWRFGNYVLRLATCF